MKAAGFRRRCAYGWAVSDFVPSVSVDLFGPGTALIEQLMAEAERLSGSVPVINPSLFCDPDMEWAAIDTLVVAKRSKLLKAALLCVTAPLEPIELLHLAAMHAVIAALTCDLFDDSQLFALRLPWMTVACQ